MSIARHKIALVNSPLSIQVRIIVINSNLGFYKIIFLGVFYSLYVEHSSNICWANVFKCWTPDQVLDGNRLNASNTWPTFCSQIRCAGTGNKNQTSVKQANPMCACFSLTSVGQTVQTAPHDPFLSTVETLDQCSLEV